VLEFRLTSSPVGTAVRLVVLRKGRFSTTVVDRHEFANPKGAVAYVRAEIKRYRHRGWIARFDARRVPSSS
jgi:hypothetical protein